MSESELIIVTVLGYAFVIFLFYLALMRFSKKEYYLCKGYIFVKNLKVETYEDGVNLKKVLSEDPDYTLFYKDIKLPQDTKFNKEFIKGFNSM